MIKILKSYFNNKKGMSLVEVLTAMTLLALMIFCFTPLMLTYLNSINASGVKMERVYDESGKLQVLLGGGVTADGYTVSLDTVPVKLTSPTATVNGTSVASATINSNVTAYGLSSAGTDTNALGDINVGNGYSTFYTDEYGSSSGIKLFPSSLTDDFKIAYITIYGNGIKFDDLSKCSVVATGTTGEISLTQGTDYDISYHPDRPNDDDRDLLLLTVYGGGDNISFETSPLVFKHFGQRYEIQVDAPSMIMVGEKSPDNNYYYYVSRGELEDTDDGDALLIHRRTMETESDPKSGSKITLNSAMNDVEWVSATDADNYAIDSNGEKYGYYIMGGDNGQIRRFWKRPDTTITVDGETVKVDGNYYWGGDYTYYTDISLDRVTDGSNSTYQYYRTSGPNDDGNGRTYSTDVSYKFFAKRAIEKTSNWAGKDSYVNGYKLVEHEGMELASLNMYTVTALNDRARIYVSDGKVYAYNFNEEINTDTVRSRGALYPFTTSITSAKMDAYAKTALEDSNHYFYVTEEDSATGKSFSVGGLDRITKYNDTNEDYTWIAVDKDSYYTINGLSTSTNPITITSVGAIVINGYTDAAAEDVDEDIGKTVDLAKFDIVYDEKSASNYAENPKWTSHDADNGIGDGKATMTFTYPKETYMLYCGYIPGVMDLWATYSSPDIGWSGGMTKNSGDAADKANWDSADQPIYSDGTNIKRLNNYIEDSDTEYSILWRNTLGVAPTLTSGSSRETSGVQDAFYSWWDSSGLFTKKYKMSYIIYFPYTNLKYSVTGKYYDSSTAAGTYGTYNNMSLVDNLVNNDRWGSYESPDKQNYQTNGNVVDITYSYMSHPFALHIAANPSDDRSYDMSNDKGWKVLYWNNRREATTILDAASTWVPSGEDDIPVTLAVGYTMGGLSQWYNNDVYSNTIMNNGIVYLRAGDSIISRQSKGNSETTEYLCKDDTGYKLNEESNYFHQFYYLNSKTDSSTDPSSGNHIGNIWGAVGWQNNRHIDFLSLDGGKPADVAGSNNTFSNTSYNYLRCHPMSNTQVTCVTWGTSWSSNPVAMWGTERGDLLSWKCEKNDDDGDGNTVEATNDGEAMFNDKSVVVEFQSYKWVKNVSGRSFAVKADGTYNLTVGAQGETFHAGNISSNFIGFYDACSAAAAKHFDNNNDIIAAVGFISTLESVNDVSYSDDIWVACGDQSDVSPATYCGTGNFAIGNADAGTNFVTRPYITADNYQKTSNPTISGNGSSKGSWINVNYWIDCEATGKQAKNNRLYQWSAVQISTEENCNIVQINNVNGMWIATGYKDANNNDEYDDGEKARIFWTYDPRVPCGVEGGWSGNVRMYDGTELKSLSEMGGINSCATRDE